MYRNGGSDNLSCYYTCCWSPGVLSEVVSSAVLELGLTVKTELLKLFLQVVLLMREEWLVVVWAVDGRGTRGHGGGAAGVGVVLCKGNMLQH